MDHLCPFAAGDCPALPVCQEPVPRQGRLYLVWLPEASAHVPHGVPGDDQQDPLHWCVAISGIRSWNQSISVGHAIELILSVLIQMWWLA